MGVDAERLAEARAYKHPHTLRVKLSLLRSGDGMVPVGGLTLTHVLIATRCIDLEESVWHGFRGYLENSGGMGSLDSFDLGKCKAVTREDEILIDSLGKWARGDKKRGSDEMLTVDGWN